MAAHHYHAMANWTEGRSGTVSADGIVDIDTFSAPPEFKGEAGIWTPEHFLLAAVASCFVTTFKAIAEFSKFNFVSLRVGVEGSLEKTQGGYSFARIVVRPIIEIFAEAEQDRAVRLLEKTERACLISQSLKAQPEMQAEVLVTTRETAAAATR